MGRDLDKPPLYVLKNGTSSAHKYRPSTSVRSILED